MKKKIIIIILVLCSILFAGVRDDLYIKFGPKLIEAVVLVIKDEINILRQQHGLPDRTNQQLISAIDAKLADANDYDWMGE